MVTISDRGADRRRVAALLVGEAGAQREFTAILGTDAQGSHIAAMLPLARQVADDA